MDIHAIDTVSTTQRPFDSTTLHNFSIREPGSAITHGIAMVFALIGAIPLMRRAVAGGLRPRGVGRRVLGGPGWPRPGRVERHSGRERSLPEGLAEGAARETGLYLLGIERRAAGRSLLRRRAVHEAFRHGSGREWGIGASAPFVAGFLSAPHAPRRRGGKREDLRR